MIGRLAFGWVADRPWASAIQLNNTMIVLAGFLSLFGEFFSSNSWLGFYAAFFGLFTGKYIFKFFFSKISVGNFLKTDSLYAVKGNTVAEWLSCLPCRSRGFEPFIGS